MPLEPAFLLWNADLSMWAKNKGTPKEAMVADYIEKNTFQEIFDYVRAKEEARIKKEKDAANVVTKKPAAARKKPMKVMKERKANVAPETQVRKKRGKTCMKAMKAMKVTTAVKTKATAA